MNLLGCDDGPALYPRAKAVLISPYFGDGFPCLLAYHNREAGTWIAAIRESRQEASDIEHETRC